MNEELRVRVRKIKEYKPYAPAHIRQQQLDSDKEKFLNGGGVIEKIAIGITKDNLNSEYAKARLSGSRFGGRRPNI